MHTTFIPIIILLFVLLLFVIEVDSKQQANDKNNINDNNNNNGIAITSYRSAYEKEDEPIEIPNDDNDNNNKDFSWENFEFERFWSPRAVQEGLSKVRRHGPFKKFQGKDGRHGQVSSTKLGGDWVLAESKQTAIQCTAEDVLSAYLSGDLQKRWNPDQVLDCTITKINNNNNDNNNEASCYRQDLVLHSQRVIRSHTGIMKYSQRILIDKIGKHGCYCVSVRLDPSVKMTTAKKPFEKLSVYVGLKENGPNVDIYAAGVMKVNRKVVPNLVIFDASGIAGSMAGKGTLWLAAHFFETKQYAAERLFGK